jgi:hypothetical protein
MKIGPKVGIPPYREREMRNAGKVLVKRNEMKSPLGANRRR